MAASTEAAPSDEFFHRIETGPVTESDIDVRCNTTSCTLALIPKLRFNKTLYGLLDNAQTATMVVAEIKAALFTAQLNSLFEPPFVYLGDVDYQSDSSRGSLAQRYQFPWYVLVRFDGSMTDSCSGALISDQLVVLPARCLYRRANSTLMHDTLSVLFGATLSTPGEELFSFEALSVARYATAHPDFVPADPRLANNVAVIKLPRRVITSSYIKPIELATELDSTDPPNYPAYGYSLRMVGFGRTVNGYSARNLRHHRVEWADQASCERMYGTVECTATVVTVISWDDASRSVLCETEPGAPLLWYLEGSWLRPARHLLVGLGEFIRDSSCPAGPDGFIRLAPYNSWLTSFDL